MGKVWSLAKSRNGTLIILITVVSSASLTLRKFMRELPIFQFPVLLTKFFLGTLRGVGFFKKQ